MSDRHGHPDWVRVRSMAPILEGAETARVAVMTTPRAGEGARGGHCWNCGATGQNAIAVTFVFSRLHLTGSVGSDLPGDYHAGQLAGPGHDRRRSRGGPACARSTASGSTRHSGDAGVAWP